MKEESVYDFYWIGRCIGYLENIQSCNDNNELFFLISEFIDFLDEKDFKITRRLPLTNELVGFYYKLEKNRYYKISNYELKELNKITAEIKETFQAELQNIKIFTLEPKRYELQKLTNDIANLFSPNVYENLPNVAKFDFSEAGKCIAYNRPTASAFHQLRGTESVLRFFYTSFIKRDRIKNMLWASITNDLRNRQKTKKFITLYDNLDHIRTNYRNPTQHPEKIYDIYEAQDLLGLCTESVNTMATLLLKQIYFTSSKSLNTGGSIHSG